MGAFMTKFVLVKYFYDDTNCTVEFFDISSSLLNSLKFGLLSFATGVLKRFSGILFWKSFTYQQFGVTRQDISGTKTLTLGVTY